MTDPIRAAGLWPMINIEPTEGEDFAVLASPNPAGGAGAGDKTKRFLRLHVDVQLYTVANYNKIRERLSAGDREGAHRWLIDNNLLPDGTPRSHLFVKTALQKD